jgi:hypothetical protein
VIHDENDEEGDNGLKKLVSIDFQILSAVAHCFALIWQTQWSMNNAHLVLIMVFAMESCCSKGKKIKYGRRGQYVPTRFYMLLDKVLYFQKHSGISVIS